ncbi:hypothetical protein VUR80DRAFT_9972 [Thermomyces stellatus]
MPSQNWSFDAGWKTTDQDTNSFQAQPGTDTALVLGESLGRVSPRLSNKPLPRGGRSGVRQTILSPTYSRNHLTSLQVLSTLRPFFYGVDCSILSSSPESFEAHPESSNC